MVRRIIGACAILLLAFGFLIGNSAVAHAQVVANCTTALSGQTFTLSPGATITLEYTSCSDASGVYLDNSLSATGPWLTSQAFGSGSSATTISGTGAWWTRLTAGAADEGLTRTLFLMHNYTTVASYTVSITSAPSPSSALDHPQPIMQQFGHATGRSCEQDAPIGLNWSDVAAGGWGMSWAQWVNDGAGGSVCTRTLVYDADLGAWTLS